MAKVEIKMPEDFLLKISKLESRTDEILPRVLEIGAEIVKGKVQANLSSVISTRTKQASRSTGELANALGVSRALQDRDGNWNIKVGFDEPRSDGNSNAKIANILEYGRHGQPAKPFLKPAKRQSQTASIEAMKAKLESEVESL